MNNTEMASSSVSQDDIDTDFEKNSRRSRIRTARARQINPTSSCRLQQQQHELLCSPAAAASADPLVHHENEDVDLEIPSITTDELIGGETSPKNNLRNVNGSKVAELKNRGPMMKMLHGNKGKQQRERRKLREKRRSTGVVHLASTESTGGTTTGDDEESSDAGVINVSVETKRNTQQNESLSHPTTASDCDHHHLTSASCISPNVVSSRNRDKSASDLEADDENDTHDSLNQSESGGSNIIPTPTMSGLLASCENSTSTANSTPVLRPGTPTSNCKLYLFSFAIYLQGEDFDSTLYEFFIIIYRKFHI